MKKDGREVAWFRDTQGRRVGTSMRATEQGGRTMKWTTARQMMELALYGIQLMLERTAKGIGSDDATMPPLKSARRKRWSKSQQRWVEYGLATPEHGYAGDKRKLGLKPMRDLRGPGGAVTVRTKMSAKARAKLAARGLRIPTGSTKTLAPGHMLDDVRVNYVDDTRATIDISTRASRIKARANEDKARWWGWSPSDMRKLMARAAQMFPMGVAEKLFSMGLIGANAMSGSVGWFRKTMVRARRAA